MRIDLHPEAVEAAPTGEQLRVRVSVENRADEALDVAWQTELVHEDGAVIEADGAPTMRRLMSERGAEATSRTRPGLRDGFYFVRTTAAALVSDDAATPATGLAISYFEVANGTITPMEPDDFYESSSINLGKAESVGGEIPPFPGRSVR